MKTDLKKQVGTLAFQGDWSKLLPLLRANPDYVNSASETKGYSPLHQAAWHGAPAVVIGELLALGAIRQQSTTSARRTALEIAVDKHPEREDLKYLLLPQRRTLSQLLRKVATREALFESYDGNQTILDQLASVFLSEPCPTSAKDVKKRIATGFLAVAGVSMESPRATEFAHDFGVDAYKLKASPCFWRERLLPVLVALAPRANVIPIEEDWATVSDLFDPAPEQWGLRGDLFLWIEMRQALCHVAVPGDTQALHGIISNAFSSLTGYPMSGHREFFVKRLARGGMSSGHVCSEFWAERFMSTLHLRLQWLRESWAWNDQTRPAPASAI